MFAIKNGLGPQWRWLGAAFAIFGGFAGFGIGNMVQSNSIAEVMNASFGMSHWITGVVLAALTGFVLIGGIKRIGTVAEKLVPTMCIGYIVAALIVLALYAGQIPAAFGLIFSDAFSRHGGRRRLRRLDDHARHALRRGARHLLERGRARHRRHRPGGRPVASTRRARA